MPAIFELQAVPPEVVPDRRLLSGSSGDDGLEFGANDGVCCSRIAQVEPVLQVAALDDVVDRVETVARVVEVTVQHLSLTVSVMHDEVVFPVSRGHYIILSGIFL